MQYILQLIEGGRGKASKKRNFNLNGGDYQFILVLLTACLLYWSVVVSATDLNDWKSSVPKSSYAPPLSMYKTRNSQIRNTQNNQKNYSHHHNPHLKNHQHNKLPEKAPVPKANPQSWYASRSNDPRMGFFIADSTSSSSTPQQALVPQPRSLSSLPSPIPTSYYQTTTNNSKTSKSKKKKKQKKKSSRAIKTSTTSNNALVAAAALPKSDLIPFEETGTSRTFFITPLLAYLFPVFLAQMFGMGMIPAAALITLPIFLLPLGITAAIFLI